MATETHIAPSEPPTMEELAAALKKTASHLVLVLNGIRSKHLKDVVILNTASGGSSYAMTPLSEVLLPIAREATELLNRMPSSAD